MPIEEPTIKIGERIIGRGYPTYIIAEIGVNHNGILELALELIDASIRAGADAVKFQKRNLEKLYAKKHRNRIYRNKRARSGAAYGRSATHEDGSRRGALEHRIASLLLNPDDW